MTEKQVKADLMVVQLDRARTALAEAKTIGETKKIVDMAHAAQIYARRQALGEEAMAFALAIKFEAMRKLGEILANTQRSAGGYAKNFAGVPVLNRNGHETLNDLGINRKTSMVAQQLAAMPAEQFEKVKAGEISVNDVKQEIKRAKRIKQIEHLADQYDAADNSTIQIKFEDFRTGAYSIADNSIDAIITDPPYPSEFLDLWQEMFAMADRVLKPSAFLICYANHQNLDEIFRLKNNLKYYWIFKLDFTAKPIAKGRNLIATWKPVLIFQKLPFKKFEQTIEDQVKETKPFDYSSRDLHALNWGQSLGKFEWIVNTFTKPLDLVLDPFAGTGTTLVACKNTKRKCIGFEIEKKQYEKIIKGRLTDGQ